MPAGVVYLQGYLDGDAEAKFRKLPYWSNNGFDSGLLTPITGDVDEWVAKNVRPGVELQGRYLNRMRFGDHL